MNAMLLDSQGFAALIPLWELPRGVFRYCEGLKVVETGEVLKLPKDFVFPNTSQPWAQPIYAHTIWGLETYKEKALVWRIGYQAANGFSVPSAQVIDSCYVRVARNASRFHLQDVG